MSPHIQNVIRWCLLCIYFEHKYQRIVMTKYYIYFQLHFVLFYMDINERHIYIIVIRCIYLRFHGVKVFEIIFSYNVDLFHILRTYISFKYGILLYEHNICWLEMLTSQLCINSLVSVICLCFSEYLYYTLAYTQQIHIPYAVQRHQHFISLRLDLFYFSWFSNYSYLLWF